MLLKRAPRDDTHDLPPYIRVIRSKRAKRVALRLDPKDRIVNLVVPERMRIEKAVAFAEEHDRWIRDKLAELPERIPLSHGTALPILGRTRTIKISFDPSLKRTDIALGEKDITVSTNKEDPTPRLVRFLKKIILDELTTLSHDKAARIGKNVAEVKVRDTKSRWGSCSIDGRLSYSWRLVFAPYETLDYLAAHEVAHLQHHDHSPAFWAVCEELSSDYTAGKSWIRKNAQELLKYHT